MIITCEFNIEYSWAAGKDEESMIIGKSASSIGLSIAELLLMVLQMESIRNIFFHKDLCSRRQCSRAMMEEIYFRKKLMYMIILSTYIRGKRGTIR